MVSFEPIEPRHLCTAGSLDPSFGTGGLASFDPKGGNNDVVASVPLRDGSVLVVSNFTPKADVLGSIDVSLFRSDGTLDTRYGIGGTRRVGTPGLELIARDAAIQSDGKLVIVGKAVQTLATVDPSRRDSTRGGDSGAAVTEVSDVLTIRLDTRGRLDRTFGPAGLALFDVGIDQNDFATYPNLALDEAGAVSIASDGRIFIGVTATVLESQSGAGFSFETPALSVLKLDSFGRRDTTFGTNGLADVGTGARAFESPYTFFADMTIDPLGRIAVAGNKTITFDSSGPASDRSIVRFNVAGAVDKSFGNNGIAQLDDVDADINAIAVDSDGRVYVSQQTTILRLGNAGEVDGSFALERVDPVTDIGLIRDLAIDRNDRLVALAGVRENRPAIARWTRAGRADPTFGGSDALGERTGVSVFHNGLRSTVADLTIGTDGSIFVAGQRFGAAGIARLFEEDGPVANVVLPASVAAGGSGVIRIVWRAGEGIDYTTLGRNDLLLSSLNASSVGVRLVGLDTSLPFSTTAIYRFAAPANASSISVRLPSNRVFEADTLIGNRGRSAGTIRVV